MKFLIILLLLILFYILYKLTNALDTTSLFYYLPYQVTTIILLGLSLSVENLDKIIKIIRSSKTPEIAKQSILKTKWKIKRT